jgi:resuscitation-promoting factor RpfB
VLILIPLTGLVRRDEPDPHKCVPSYSKCLDPRARDYDCEGEGDGPRYTTGPIVVTGDDPFRLDPDGDGFACT